jgi:CRISPR type III-A-associated RAMP protein Csm4
MPKQEHQIIKLKFEGGLHLAKGKNVYDESASLLHSDTLKSALFACALQLYGQDQIKEDFLDGFTLSSAYPFLRDEFFFPKPFARIQEFADLDEGKQPKKLKKISFMGQSYFEDLINGGKNKLETGHLLEGGSYISEKIAKKNVQLVQSDVQQRVAIPPDHRGDGRPYFVDRLFFHPDAGLYFMIQYADEQMKPYLMGALRLLGDQGIGTDRNVGNGHFSIEEAMITLQTPEQADRNLLLSLYCPQRKELNAESLQHSSYQLIKRGGYMASAANVNNITLRKRSVYMFTEGSVFPVSAQLVGKRLDLKPEISTVNHSVWRDGRAFFIPMKSIQ